MPNYLIKINHIKKAIKNIPKSIENSSRELLIEILQEKIKHLIIESEKAHTLSERKFVTILFADISGFTAMSEKLDPEQVKQLLNNCFDQLVPIIEKHGGYIDKFIGDEIMALFGAPIASENAVSAALIAAIEMLDALHQYNSKKSIKLGMHIGINSGLAVTGGLGSIGKKHYTVIGDAVNLASRLENLAKNGEIVVGEETYQHAKKEFAFKALEKLPIKGKKALVQPYLLLEKKTDFRASQIVSKELFVGRKKELQTIKNAIAAYQQANKLAIIGIYGEAGIGKSVFVQKLLFEPNKHLTIFYTKAMSFQKINNYSFAADMLRGMLHLDSGANEEILDSVLNSLKPKIKKEYYEETFAHVALLLKIKLSKHNQSLIENQSSLLTKALIERSVYFVLNSFCSENKITLVIEDGSWIDESSKSLLLFLQQQKYVNNPIFIFTERKLEEIKSLSYNRLPQMFFPLAPLSKTIAIKMVNHYIKDPIAKNVYADKFIAKSDGNPLLLNEILRTYVASEQNNLAFKDGFRNTTFNLQSIFSARLDNLPNNQKEIIRTAAVIGSSFTLETLEKLLPKTMAKLALKATVEDLIKAAIFTINEEEKIEFTNKIYADVAYQNLLKTKRKILHGKYANILMLENLEEPKGNALSIANHLELSTKPLLAIKYLERAIKDSTKTGSNVEAIKLIERLLPLIEQLEKNDKKLPLNLSQTYNYYLELKGELNLTTGNHIEGMSNLEELISRTNKQDKFKLAFLYTRIAFGHRSLRKGALIVENAQKAIAILKEIPSQEDDNWQKQYIETHNALVWGYYFSQNTDMLNKALQANINFVKKFGTHAQKADWYYAIVGGKLTKNRFNDIPKKITHITEASLKESILSKDKMLTALKYCETGFAYTWSNEPEKAIPFFTKSIQLSAACFYTEPWITSINYLCLLYRKEGDVKNLRKYVQIGLDLAEKTNSHYITPILGSYLAYYNLKGAKKMAKEIMFRIDETKNQLPPNYPLKFMWEGPQFEWNIINNNWENAYKNLMICLEPTQKKWPITYTALMQRAIKHWNNKEMDKYKLCCMQIIKNGRSQKLGLC